jgi:hypothetical protein
MTSEPCDTPSLFEEVPDPPPVAPLFNDTSTGRGRIVYSRYRPRRPVRCDDCAAVFVHDPKAPPSRVAAYKRAQRPTAERIAAYANLRTGGARPVDARHKVGISDHTCRIYERFLPQLLQQLGLPELPEYGPVQYPRDQSAYAFKGAHQRNHVQRGVISPDCPLCQDGTR